MTHPLQPFGYSTVQQENFAQLAFDGARPARVIALFRGRYRVVDRDGERSAELSGRFRHACATAGPEPSAPADSAAAGQVLWPAVGDWVAIVGDDPARIEAVLPRSSALSRKAAGRAAEAQVLAANIDAVFLLAALDRDFNARRIERALALIWSSGAQPVLLLSKVDVCAAPEAAADEARAVAPGVPVHLISALVGTGVEALAPYLAPGRTVSLLGSSGVGKSTLLNRLFGSELQKVDHIRARDGRGQHTTTSSRLIRLDSGALLIDMPGVREVGLLDDSEGLSAAFGDVESLAAACRFADCGHGHEPGCAVLAAIEAGELPAERLASFLKLQREQAFIERKLDARAALNAKRRWKSITRQYRARSKFLRGAGKLRS